MLFAHDRLFLFWICVSLMPGSFLRKNLSFVDIVCSDQRSFGGTINSGVFASWSKYLKRASFESEWCFMLKLPCSCFKLRKKFEKKKQKRNDRKRLSDYFSFWSFGVQSEFFFNEMRFLPQTIR